MSPLKRLWAWTQTDKVRRRILLGFVAAGASALRHLLEENDQRLEALEERGLVPIDDLATVGDLGKLEGRLLSLENLSRAQSLPVGYRDPEPPASMGEVAP